MKQTIKLNESQLREIVKESVMTVLKEHGVGNGNYGEGKYYNPRRIPSKIDIRHANWVNDVKRGDTHDFGPCPEYYNFEGIPMPHYSDEGRHITHSMKRNISGIKKWYIDRIDKLYPNKEAFRLQLQYEDKYGEPLYDGEPMLRNNQVILDKYKRLYREPLI